MFQGRDPLPGTLHDVGRRERLEHPGVSLQAPAPDEHPIGEPPSKPVGDVVQSPPAVLDASRGVAERVMIANSGQPRGRLAELPAKPLPRVLRQALQGGFDLLAGRHHLLRGVRGSGGPQVGG